MRRPLRTVVVDDEPLARDNVRLVLDGEAIEWVGEAGTGARAVEVIRETDPDLVLLDIELPDVGGFDVLGRIGSDRRPAVIFVTAFREHAVEAFDVHAVDYVVKPFRDSRLRDAVDRVRARLEAGEAERLRDRLETMLDQSRPGIIESTPVAADGPTDGPPARRILVGERESRHFLAVEDIDWLEADGNYVRIHVGGAVHEVRVTLAGLLERLDPTSFRRIHRSTAVNLDRIVEIQPWFAGRYLVILDDGTELRVSRGYRDGLLRLTL